MIELALHAHLMINKVWSLLNEALAQKMVA